MRARYLLALLATLFPAVARAGQQDESLAIFTTDTSVTAPLAKGDYLTGEQIKALVSGKTLNITDRDVHPYRAKAADRFHYYAADGMAYFMTHDSGNEAPTVDRGTWLIANNRLCTHGMYASPCLGIRRTKGTHLQAVYPGKNNVWDIAILPGDPKKVAETVSHYPPYNEPTPNPQVPATLAPQ